MKKISILVLIFIILTSLSVIVYKYNLSTKYPTTFICGNNTVKDIDNNIYNTVKIGSQCWLKENLKVVKNPAGEVITRYCYDNDPKICDTDGGLYDWNTAMNNSTKEGVQGICPNGWHIPKDSEWYVLENYLKDIGQHCDRRSVIMADEAGRCLNTGTKLKAKGSSGFDAVLAGIRSDYGSRFIYRGMNAYFWSSTSTDFDIVYRYIDSFTSGIEVDTENKRVSFSVRCLKD